MSEPKKNPKDCIVYDFERDNSVKIIQTKHFEELKTQLSEFTMHYQEQLKARPLTLDDLNKLSTPQQISEYLLAVDAVDPEPEKPQVKIERAPGFALFGFLSTICSKKFVERELSALLADGNVQYQELLASGDTAGAWRWKWSMRVAMVSTVFRGGLGALLGLVKFKAQSSE